VGIAGRQPVTRHNPPEKLPTIKACPPPQVTRWANFFDHPTCTTEPTLGTVGTVSGTEPVIEGATDGTLMFGASEASMRPGRCCPGHSRRLVGTRRGDPLPAELAGWECPARGAALPRAARGFCGEASCWMRRR